MAVKILELISLKDYSTMRLGGLAKYLCEIKSKEDLIEAIKWAAENNQPTIMIGGGSNIFWSDDGFDGLVIVNKIKGYQETLKGSSYIIEVGAGEVWDGVVKRAVNAGATGIEALSLIPGSAGATMVQNVGAYGQEISQTLIELEAYDNSLGKFIKLSNKQCAFGYRTSRFKTTDKGRFFITSIKLGLKIGDPQKPYYPAVENYLTEKKLLSPTAKIIRQAVIEIRTNKLPDPAVVANNGSFFANPIIDKELFKELKNEYPTVIYWPVKGGKYKISAAWLIETAGFKGVHDQETGMSTWDKQPLVLVNEHAKSTHDLLTFKQKITDTVFEDFNITLEQEPEMLP